MTQWNSITLQGVNLTQIDTTAQFPVGQIIQASHPTYGAGEFIYLKGTASTVAGDVVEVDTYTPATTRWAGTVSTGKPLAIAMAATVASTYGWYQIGGAALVNLGGNVAAGAAVFWQATAVVDDAQVSGKQMAGATFLAAGTSGGQGLVQINRPHVQHQYA